MKPEPATAKPRDRRPVRRRGGPPYSWPGRPPGTIYLPVIVGEISRQRVDVDDESDRRRNYDS